MTGQRAGRTLCCVASAQSLHKKYRNTSKHVHHMYAFELSSHKLAWGCESKAQRYLNVEKSSQFCSWVCVYASLYLPFLYLLPVSSTFIQSTCNMCTLEFFHPLLLHGDDHDGFARELITFDTKVRTYVMSETVRLANTGLDIKSD